MRHLKAGSYQAVEGEYYGTPKELWGFRSQGVGSPREVAEQFLRTHAGLLGLERDLSTLQYSKTIPSLGANHVIFQQVLGPRRVHRAYVTVHCGRDRRVYLTKNRAVPAAMQPRRDGFPLKREEGIRKARRSLPSRNRRVVIRELEEMWFPRKDRLVPALKVRLTRQRPREEWIVYVNARTGGILSRYDNLSKATRGRARIFDPNPVIALGGHDQLLTGKFNAKKIPQGAYRERTLWGLRGNGRLEGQRVTTGPTPAGHRVKRTSHEFFLDSRARGFEETMAYYHVDAAIRYLARLGFRGSRRIFDDLVRVNARATTDDDSWYSPSERLLAFGSGEIDDAEDGETILHEMGHAIQDAICRDFGQSEEAAAMGEGFGDYFAASFFADKKDPRYRTSVMTWDGILLGLEEGLDPPALRRVDWNWTYDDFIEGDDEHDNGEIWSATLWDIREALGGETADRIIVESHFQLDGFTTFARGARAVVDADRNLNAGRNRNKLKAIFRARKIYPL